MKKRRTATKQVRVSYDLLARAQRRVLPLLAKRGLTWTADECLEADQHGHCVESRGMIEGDEQQVRKFLTGAVGRTEARRLLRLRHPPRR